MDTIYNKVMKEISPNQSNIRNNIVYEVNSQTPFTGFVIKHYDTAGIHFKICYKDGVEDGPWEYYYKNGQLEEKGTYKNKKRNGPWETYHDNGQLKEKGTYKDDNLDGPEEFYYENGQLKEKTFYKDGFST